MPVSTSTHRSCALVRSFALAIASTGISCFLIGTGNAETWTDLYGNHSVEARMIGLWDGNVVLQLDSGRRVTIRMDKLRSESRIQAQELAKGLAASRGGRVKELQGQAAEAAAPAPNPLPKPPAAPPYVAPKKDVKPIEFLAQLDLAVSSGHLLAIYDALPPSYRKDVSEIVKLSAEKISPDTWNGLVGTAQRLGDLIVTRQKWFLSSPRVQALPSDQLVQVEDQLLTFAGLMREGLDPDAMQLDKLKTVDFRQWLAERDEAMAPYIARLFQNSTASTIRQMTLESEKDGVAVVSIEKDESTAKISLTLVEGYWVPKTIADQWADSVQAWKTELTGEADVTFLDSYALMLEPISPMLQPLTQAGDAGEFHEAMEGLLAPAETLATSLAVLSKSLSLASSGGGYDDYGMGDEYGMDDDYGDMEDYDYEMEMEMEMESQ